MRNYVVKQPVKNIKNETVGYEVNFNETPDCLYNASTDSDNSNTLATFLLQNGDMIFDDKLTFITFTPNLLFENTPKIFKEKDLIIQIEENVIIHPLAYNLINKYRKEGYKIAVKGFRFNNTFMDLAECIDYIKIDILNTKRETTENVLKFAEKLKIKCIATNIDTKELYTFAHSNKFEYFQGDFVEKIMTKKINKTEYLKSNFFLLMQAVTKEEPDIDEIDSIISKDAMLTYSILKMVNSAHFALRRRTTSVKQAIVTLGLTQIKNWVYLLSFNANTSSGTEDFLNLSLLRANFCAEIIPYFKGVPLSKGDAYLVGMFSTLESLVDATLPEILKDIPMRAGMKDALITKTGMAGLFFDLVLSYERADWEKIESITEVLNVPKELMAQLYIDSVAKTEEFLQSIKTPMHDDDDAKKTGAAGIELRDIIKDRTDNKEKINKKPLSISNMIMEKFKK